MGPADLPGLKFPRTGDGQRRRCGPGFALPCTGQYAGYGRDRHRPPDIHRRRAKLARWHSICKLHPTSHSPWRQNGLTLGGYNQDCGIPVLLRLIQIGIYLGDNNNFPPEMNAKY